MTMYMMLVIGFVILEIWLMRCIMELNQSILTGSHINRLVIELQNGEEVNLNNQLEQDHKRKSLIKIYLIKFFYVICRWIDASNIPRLSVWIIRHTLNSPSNGLSFCCWFC